jgi:hypothetical protein
MVGRIGIVQRPRTAEDEENLALWYDLGRLYRESGRGAQRATKVGFTSVCASGALVLLSAPVFGTAWAGPFAAAIPVAAGLLSGGGLFLRQRTRLRRRADVIRERLAERGLDAARPARDSKRQHGMEPPALGPREELAYRVFPREMTVPAELSMRRAYLDISRRLLLERYGPDPYERSHLMPEALRQRVKRDLREYEALFRRPPGRW